MGNLKLLKYINNELQDFSMLLIIACKFNKIEIIEYLISIHSFNEHAIYNAIRISCLNDNLESLKALCIHFNIKNEYFRINSDLLLFPESTNVSKFIIEKFEFEKNEIVDNLFIFKFTDEIFIKYILDKFIITASDITSNNNLLWISINCDEQFIIFLCKYFFSNMSSEDIRSNGNALLNYSCKYGRIYLVKFLIRVYKLNEIDIRSNYNFSIRKAIKYGHWKLVKFLIKKFNITKKDLSILNYSCLKGAYRHNNIFIFNKLIRMFCLNKVEVLREDSGTSDEDW
jgi:ankyrin repeat protein